MRQRRCLRHLPRGLAAALLAAALLTACAHAPRIQTTLRTADTASIRLDRVYVYSFLDVRDHELGQDFISQFDRQLREALQRDGVTSEVLWFKESPVAATYSLAPTGTRNSSTTHIPIAEVIAANRKAESMFHPTHLLIVFPAQIMTGNGISLTVRWDLVDKRLGKVVWQAKSTGYHIVFSNRNEMAEERARLLVGAFDKELHQDGLVR